MQNETRVLRGARLNQRVHLSHYLTTLYLPPTLTLLHPCTYSTPTPLHFNLSLKGRTNGPSKVFFSMSLSSQMTHVPTPLLWPSTHHTLFLLVFYTLYMFSIILPSIPTTNTEVSVMLSASWQSSGWCSGGMCAYVCWGGGKAGLLCILSLI